MPTRPNFGAGNRNLLNQAGKGDKDRSPGYRKFYDDINFKSGDSQTDDGFRRVSPSRIRKTYRTQPEQRKVTGAEIDAIFAPKAQRQTDVPAVSPPLAPCCGGHCGCDATD